MRPLFITGGSRGDIEPVFALSSALLKSPNVDKIILVISSDSIPLAPPQNDRFQVYPLQLSPGLNKDYLPAFKDDNDTEEHKPVAEIDLLGCAIRDLIIPQTKRIVNIAVETNATIVITTFGALPIANIIAEKMCIPLVYLQYQPVVPTRYYPHLTLHAKEAAVGTYALQKGDTSTHNSFANIESHFNFIRNGFRPCLKAINTTRADYGLQPVSLEYMCDILQGKPEKTHVIVATSPQLLPRSPDMASSVHIVGSLATNYIPMNWQAESLHLDLCTFLAEHPPPVVISYGSMAAQGVGPSLTRALLSGLRKAGVESVVLIPGNAKLSLDYLSEPSDESLLIWARKHVFVTKGNVQFAWLLPQCEMIFCHCGAGTTGIALAHALPILATPVMTDQIYFAELIDLMKVGHRVGTIGLPSITAEEVAKGVQVARNASIRGEAQKFSIKEKKRGDSVAELCKVLESFVDE